MMSSNEAPGGLVTNPDGSERVVHLLIEEPYDYQSRGVPLYLQEAFEDPTLQSAPPFLTGTLTSA